MIGLAIIGNMGFMIQPVLIGGMVDLLGISPNQAGTIVSGEMIGFAVASVLATFVVNRWDRRAMAWAGIYLYMLGNIASGYADGYWSLLLLRSLTGFGAGVLIAMFNASGAGTRRPERLFATAIGLFLVFGSIFLFISPAVLSAGGLAATYGLLVALSIPVLVVVYWLPPRVTAAEHKLDDGEKSSKWLAMTLSLIAMLVLFTGTSALWAFQERIGSSIGLAAETIGLVLGFATVGGVLGAALAFFIGVRFGRTIIVTVSIAALCIAAILLTFSNGFNGFLTAALLIPISWYLILPIIIGMLAWLDTTGRLLTFSAAIYSLGMALGPALAAFLLGDTNEYAILGWGSLTAYIVAIIILFPVASKIDRSEKMEQHKANDFALD